MTWQETLLLTAILGFVLFVIGFVRFFDQRAARRADIKRQIDKVRRI